MRVELISHSKPCMTETPMHVGSNPVEKCIKMRAQAQKNADDYGVVWKSSADDTGVDTDLHDCKQVSRAGGEVRSLTHIIRSFRNHARLRLTYIFDTI